MMKLTSCRKVTPNFKQRDGHNFKKLKNTEVYNNGIRNCLCSYISMFQCFMSSKQYHSTHYKINYVNNFVANILTIVHFNGYISFTFTLATWWCPTGFISRLEIAGHMRLFTSVVTSAYISHYCRKTIIFENTQFHPHDQLFNTWNFH